jgi:histidinol-phosphate aminotransferase
MTMKSSPLSSLLRPQLAQLDAYVPHAAPEGCVRMDANESPPLDAAITEAILRSADSVRLERYPDARATRLRAAVASWARCAPSQLVLGTGSDEPIALLLSTLSQPKPGRARAVCLVPTPTFVMYRVSALTAGLDVEGVPLDERWDLDVDAMVAGIDRHEPNVLFLASPNNPTANRYSDDRVARVIDACRDRCLVVLDEAYAPFSGRDYADTMAPHPHVARLGTLSKIGLAALRVGWAILPEILAHEIDKARQPFNVDAVAQAMAAFALEAHADALRANARAIAARRDALARELSSIDGLRVFDSDANFLWMDVGRDAGPVFDALLAQGVLVRSFHRAGPRLASLLRVTVSTEAHHERLVTALREAVR